MKKDVKKKIMAAAGAVCIGLAGAFAGAMIADDSTTVDSLNTSLTLANEKITELEAREPVVIHDTEVITKTEYVDNGKLNMVLDYLEDNFGDDYLVFEDVNEIVANIEMEDEYKSKAISAFKDEWKDYVAVPTGYVLSDGRLVKVRDAEVRAIDYDDKEFVVTFEAEIEFEDDDSKTTKFYNVTYDFDLDRDDEEDVQVSVELV